MEMDHTALIDWVWNYFTAGAEQQAGGRPQLKECLTGPIIASGAPLSTFSFFAYSNDSTAMNTSTWVWQTQEASCLLAR